MDLIVLESPNKVADVERHARQCGFNARVMASAGHLVDLPPMAQGPCVDVQTFRPEKLVPRDSRAEDRIVRLKREIARAARVIVATDPDREGEAIAAQVWQLVPPGKAWRARFQEITAAGVARGLANLQPHLDTHAVDASALRRLVDRLAGWHATSLVFEKLPQHRGMSAGRLQSAALRLIVERFREHVAFVPSTTYRVRVRISARGGREFQASLMGPEGRALFATEDDAKRADIPETVRVARLESKRRREPPPPPFETASWLQVAQKALGLSVEDALAATQSLFESGRATYPRTDSVRVSDEAIEWARRELARRFGPEFVPAEPWTHRDSQATVQGAHEAIRPTLTRDPSELEGRAAGPSGESYALIEARFLASQSSAREVQETTARLEGDGVLLVARGHIELFQGRMVSCRRALADRHQSSVSRVPEAHAAQGTEQDERPLLLGLLCRPGVRGGRRLRGDEGRRLCQGGHCGARVTRPPAMADCRPTLLAPAGSHCLALMGVSCHGHDTLAARPGLSSRRSMSGLSRNVQLLAR
jgi:DNA topoisomerase I